jgi:hypothetical protein
MVLSEFPVNRPVKAWWKDGVEGSVREDLLVNGVY